MFLLPHAGQNGALVWQLLQGSGVGRKAPTPSTSPNTPRETPGRARGLLAVPTSDTLDNIAPNPNKANAPITARTATTLAARRQKE